MPLVGLFIPCYIDQLYPQVALAALRVLRQLGLNVEFPPEQTCCGQPMANAGCAERTRPLAERFLKIFARYDHVVSPSGSCVSMVRNHYAQWLEGSPGFDHLRANTFELCEYLVDIVGVTRVDGDFPVKVGLHMSCHGLRELRLASSSEQMVTPFNKVRQLLAQLKGIELIELTRPDECCGFGGTFAVDEEAVSSLMGRDRIADHLRGGAEVITGFDVSCLMHLDGIIRRQALAAGAASVAAYPAAKLEKTPLRVLHVAQILEAARLS
jgi:L-lactate dehydrogenase complex protein LldE